MDTVHNNLLVFHKVIMGANLKVIYILRVAAVEPSGSSCRRRSWELDCEPDLPLGDTARTVSVEGSRPVKSKVILRKNVASSAFEDAGRWSVARISRISASMKLRRGSAVRSTSKSDRGAMSSMGTTRSR